jgi:hypothetical protein
MSRVRQSRPQGMMTRNDELASGACCSPGCCAPEPEDDCCEPGCCDSFDAGDGGEAEG